MRRTILVGSLALVGLATTPALAQDPTYPVAIVAGACADLGEVVEELDDAEPAEGDAAGAASAVLATESFTTFNVPLETMLGEPHAVVVGASDDPLACGDIGGNLDEEGGVTFGLAAVGESGLSGLAYLSPVRNGARTFGQVAVLGGELGDASAAEGDEADDETDDDETEEQPAADASPEAAEGEEED
ncbi:MAG: hypothetical protein H0U10_14665 [Chloroflexia bacterium]|nr:hypothetical protein [Chloroflexia bacterium]